MEYRKSADEYFFSAAVKKVAEAGIESMRTKDVSELTGHSEATLFRRFSSKEALLREAFLDIDNRLSDIIVKSAFIRNPGSDPFELAFYVIWKQFYRYLIDNGEETLFVIRYMNSSLYTDAVRSMRQMYNGGFDQVYSVIKNHFGVSGLICPGFAMDFIYEITVSFAGKVVTGKIADTPDTERAARIAAESLVKCWTERSEEK